MAESDTERARCRHVGCPCPAPESADYCSTECARVATGGIARSPCACGHDACQEGEGDPAEPKPEAWS